MRLSNIKILTRAGDFMRDEYNIKELNPRKNPYVKKKQQVTIRLDEGTVIYFKNMAEESGIPYQTLINMYLTDCAKENKKLQFV